METNFRKTNLDNIQNATIVNERSLFASVFTWMFVALGITTACSLVFAYNADLGNLLFKFDEFGNRVGTSVIGWIVMLAPLGLVLVMNFAFNKLSFISLMGIFFGFATLMGISLSSIFLMYRLDSIGVVFASTCALFGVMAVAGYTTKADLTKMGSLLMIGLIGIVIASLINMFMKSDTMGYVISIISVIVFTGLTAYDVQKIKALAEANDGSSDFKKLGVMGALTLYLDFINLFLSLLRLFGKRD
ncbi:MAG: Bax inhibitor/YccA family protein [Bacteroidota bacterium]|jgi:FtsH-binding integral membrane protein|nr:Bax inhibitor/YccA family protein [Bacteroidota bacterium]